MFRCWGHARLALVLLGQDRLDEAATHIDQALALGPDLARYEARLAQCGLAVRRGDDDAGALIDEALADRGQGRACRHGGSSHAVAGTQHLTRLASDRYGKDLQHAIRCCPQCQRAS